ncbi:hypothetical protein CSV76_15230 [Sporosarcina sp. P17b]|nr:hypothetical protein CSV76_15230 [Sporosarcina sp. P17b]
MSGRRAKEFALYKGEELLAIGTYVEIAKELKVQPRTIRYYGSSAYKRKIAKRKNPKSYREIVRLDGAEE